MAGIFLISAFGKDRPGQVARLARALYELGGNMEDASMTRLGSEFAMMLVVSLPKAVSGARLEKTLKSVSASAGLTLNVKPVSIREIRRSPQSEPQYLISVYGTDQPGIVYRVTQALADRSINITDLNTKTVPRHGKPLYIMLLEVQAPASKAEAFKRDLHRLSRSLGVEITVQDIDPVAL